MPQAAGIPSSVLALALAVVWVGRRTGPVRITTMLAVTISDKDAPALLGGHLAGDPLGLRIRLGAALLGDDAGVVGNVLALDRELLVIVLIK